MLDIRQQQLIQHKVSLMIT